MGSRKKIPILLLPEKKQNLYSISALAPSFYLVAYNVLYYLFIIGILIAVSIKKVGNLWIKPKILWITNLVLKIIEFSVEYSYCRVV